MEFLLTLLSLGDLSPLALRLALGVIFLVHGTAKLAMWKMQPSPQMPAGMINTMRVLSVVEPISAVAVLLGFLTQVAAAVFAVIMFGALYYKIKVWKMPFTAMDKTGWEYDFLILAASLALFYGGGGALSLDRFLFGL